MKGKSEKQIGLADLPPHLASLIKDLENKDVEVRKVAAIKLSELKEPKTLDFIRAKSDDSDDLVRYFLEKAISETVRDVQVREAVLVFGKGDPSLANSTPQQSIPYSPGTTALSRPSGDSEVSLDPVLKQRDLSYKAPSPKRNTFPWYAHVFFIMTIIAIAVFIPRQEKEHDTQKPNDEVIQIKSGGESKNNIEKIDPRKVFKLAEEGLHFLKAGNNPDDIEELSSAAALLEDLKRTVPENKLPEKFDYYYYLCRSKGGHDLKNANQTVRYLERFYQRNKDDIFRERALVNLIGFYFSKTLAEKKLSSKLVDYIRDYRLRFPLGSARVDVETITAHLVKIGVVKLEEL